MSFKHNINCSKCVAIYKLKADDKKASWNIDGQFNNKNILSSFYFTI